MPHLEVLVAEESVHHPEAQNVRHLGVPLDDDRVLLPVGVLHDDLGKGRGGEEEREGY